MATAQIDPQLERVRARLPAGFRIEAGGATEESAKGENSVKVVMPLMLVGVVTLLMIQLQNVGRSLLVLVTAPLGLIGVALALRIFNVPFGVVANLGVIALSGIIMRNAVILAMIPLARSVFWGPMAVAIMGRLIVATLLARLFLPARHAACYRVKALAGGAPGITDGVLTD